MGIFCRSAAGYAALPGVLILSRLFSHLEKDESGVSGPESDVEVERSATAAAEPHAAGWYTSCCGPLLDSGIMGLARVAGLTAKTRKGGKTMARPTTSGSKRSQEMTDHEEIRQWAEARGGFPARVKGTGGEDDVGMIRIDFPGYSGEGSLERISWEEWFEKFEERELALVVENQPPEGDKARFNKLVSRHHSQATQGHEDEEGRDAPRGRRDSDASAREDLKAREYRDKEGHVHHHTHPYMEQHGEQA